MKILMFTNTYLPHVGGVARSVHMFAEAFRAAGHEVLVVAPEFADAPTDETDVIRVPAIQHFNGSDFAVRLPSAVVLTDRVHAFDPDIVHSHHPFLLGGNAATLAAMLEVPLVFTHHTMYENYTHYVPGDSPAMQRYAVALTTGYANLCDGVIAPSGSVRDIDVERGVTAKIRAISTGVDLEKMQSGVGERARETYGIPAVAYVIGHVGRLAAEKNLPFLTRAVCTYLQDDPDARFLVVGDGSARQEVDEIAESLGVSDQFIATGTLSGQDLSDAYAAMDLFAFASTSETQGMVVAEAMAAGSPVLAVDANGVRDVVEDGVNGRLLDSMSEDRFVESLAEMRRLEPDARQTLVDGALATGRELSQENCAERTLAFYEELIDERPDHDDEAPSAWKQAIHLLDQEWHLMQTHLTAAGEAIDTLIEEARDTIDMTIEPVVNGEPMNADEQEEETADA